MFSFQHELVTLIAILLTYLLIHSLMYLAPSSIPQFIILLSTKACSGVKHWDYNSKQSRKSTFLIEFISYERTWIIKRDNGIENNH